jgi:Family of unknown function (DUF6236)
MKRQLITTSRIVDDRINGKVLVDGFPQRELLATYLMYWDSVDILMVNGFGPNLTLNDEVRELVDLGAVVRSMVEVDPEDMSADVQEELAWAEQYAPKSVRIAGRTLLEMQVLRECAQAQLFSKRSTDLENKYAIGQSGGFFSYRSRMAAESENTYVELSDVMPMPDVSVYLPTIVKFRQKRREEFLLFRRRLDSLLQGIAESKSTEELRERVRSAKEEFELSLLELCRVLDESGVQKVTRSLRTALAIPASEFITALVSTHAAQNLLHAPVGVLELAGLGIVGALQVFKRREPAIARVPENCRDFLYLYSISKKFS